jgi:hypothetical protein
MLEFEKALDNDVVQVDESIWLCAKVTKPRKAPVFIVLRILTSLGRWLRGGQRSKRGLPAGTQFWSAKRGSGRSPARQSAAGGSSMRLGYAWR